jgi:DNA primase
MGNITKEVIIVGIASILIIFMVSLSYFEFNLNQKIERLSDQAALYSQKREELAKEMASLAAINNSLTTRLALEKNKAEKTKILNDLQKLNAEQQLSLLNEQARLDTIKKQDALNAANAASAQVTTVNTTTKNTVTRAS